MTFKGADTVFNTKITNTASELLEQMETKGTISKGLKNMTYSVSVNKVCLSSFNRNKRDIMEDLNLKKKNRKYRISFTRNKYKIYPSDDGLYPGQWQKFLDQNQLVRFFRACHYSHNGVERTPMNLQPCEVISQVWEPSVIDLNEEHEHATELEPLDCDMEDDDSNYYYSLNDERFSYTDSETPGLLSECILNENVLSKVVSDYKKTLSEKLLTIEDISVKNPFTLPFVAAKHLVEGELDLDFIVSSDPIVNLVLKKIQNAEFAAKYVVPEKLLQEKRELHKDVRKMMLEYKTVKLKPEILRPEEQKVYYAMKDKDKVISDEIKKSKRSIDNSTVKLNRQQVKDYKPDNFRDHSKKSSIRGINREFSNQGENFIDLCLTEMLEENGLLVKDFAFDYGTDTPSMLKYKEKMMSKHAEAYSKIEKMNFNMMSEFVQRFCYTLLYFSQKSVSGEQYMFSNLGFSNVFLLCKGGKKIWNTQKTRLYKLIYPVPDFFYHNQNLFSSSTKFYQHNNVTYLETSWSTLEERVMEDKTFFNYKTKSQVVNYMVRNENFLNGNAIDLKNIMWNNFLSYNNRRSTEVLLGPMRNFVANLNGKLTNFSELIKEFVVIPQDVVQLYILNCIEKNTMQHYKQLIGFIDSNMSGELIHLFSKSNICDENDYTHLLYSTYSMTKAPYNQRVEQSKNLQKMMVPHVKYMETIGVNDFNDFYDLTNKEGWECFDNEFYVNYRYAFHLGTVFSGIIRSGDLIPELHGKWLNIMAKPATSIINSSGLRGIFGERGFFGRKSPEVVVEELLKIIKEKNLHEEYVKVTVFDKEKVVDQKVIYKLADLDITMSDLMNIYADKDMVFKFHVVDKTQKNGSREIYVMDMRTKTFCWSLEQYFSYLCKLIDNELISIPSNKRLYTIHSRLFERTGTREQVRYYLTLDCKRWGPMSVFLKYTYMILGAADVLPKSMVNLFLYVTYCYFKKEIIVSPGAFKVFQNNLTNAGLLKYFDTENCKFNMPYSFIMGIFNYLSSMMHALNQIDATRRVCDNINAKYNVGLTFYMDAHSDDSGGYMTMNNVKDKDMIMAEAVRQYEYWLRQVNHMLSVKKCVISETYFELLSILYVNNKLLPVVPKFFSSLDFKPTMEGFSADVSQSYSKCIELVSMGATFSEAYYIMRQYSEMVVHFYNLERKSDRPVNCFGGAFAHPLLVLLVGSLSDNCRLYKVDPVIFNKYQSVVKVLTAKDNDSFITNGFKPFDKIVPTSSQTAIKNTIGELFAHEVHKDLFKNVKFKHSMLYMPCLYNMLDNTTYLASLNYGTNVRRLTKLFHNKNLSNIKVLEGNYSIKEISVLIDYLVYDMDDGENKFPNVLEIANSVSKVDPKKQELLFDYMLGEANTIYDYLSDSMSDNVRLERQKITCKPCTIDVELSPINVNISTNLDAIYYYGTEDYYYFLNPKSLSRDQELCFKLLDMIGAEHDTYEKFMFYMRKLQKYTANYHIYSYVATGNRAVKNHLDMFSMIETNSVYGMHLTRIYVNITAKYKNKITYDPLDPLLKKEIKTIKIETLLKQHTKRKFEPIQPSRRESIVFKNDIANLKKMDIKLLNNFYIWLDRSKKLSDHWFGSSKVLVSIEGLYFVAGIESGVLTKIECDDFDRASTYSLNNVIRFLQSSEVRIVKKISNFVRDFSLGEKDGIVKIDMQKNLDFTYCDIESNRKDYVNYLSQGKCKIIDPFTLRNLRNNWNLKIISSEIVLSKEDMAPYNLSYGLMSKMGLKNFFLVPDENLDKFTLIENIEKTKVYSHLIKDKLYKRESFLSRVSKLQGYESISKVLVSELIKMNVNPNNVPDIVWDQFSKQLTQSNFEENLSVMIDDLSKCHTTEDYDNFMSTWNMEGDSGLRLYDQSVNYRLFKNPELLKLKYPGLVVDSVNCLLKTIYSCFDQHLTEVFNRVHTEFPGKVTQKMIMELIYKYLWINSFPKPQNDGYFKYIRKIFQCIFEDKRAFVKFKNEVATNNLLSALPMSQDGYNDWFRLFCKLTLGTMKGINYNYNQLVEDYYKRVRTVKTIQLPYDIGFIGKPMKLTSQSFKIKINKDLEGTLIFKFIDSRVTRKPWNALTSCYEPQVIDCEQSYENNDLEDFCDEMGYDIQSGSEAWAEAKEEFGASFDYFNWDFKWHQSTEKLIEVPMVTVMGKTNLDFIATNYNYYILITDTVPSDINLQPKGRVKCYHMPHPIPELFYIFAYNLPHELNLPKWDYKSFGLMNNIRNNPKFNYYINEKLIQFGEDSTSFEKYFRYMGSMSTNNQNLQQRGMIEKKCAN